MFRYTIAFHIPGTPIPLFSVEVCADSEENATIRALDTALEEGKLTMKITDRKGVIL